MTINMLLGNGDGTFAADTVFSAGNTPFCTALADFDGDGDLDAATANWHGNNVTILNNFTFTANQLPPPPPQQLGSLSGFCFNDTNVNKKSLTLNVRSAKGLEIVKRLVAISDIVIENFSSRVLQKWGL